MPSQRLAAALSLLAVLAAAPVHGARTGLLDLIQWEDAKKLLEIPELRNEQNNRNCECKGPACICCVNFNVTVVDLGGPGCVHMKYLSPEEGFSVNVSYGKNLLHSSKIQGASPQPICLNLLSKYAQLCARFSELAPTSDGLRGCLQLEPKILGDTQLEFPMGCFRSNSGGMEMEEQASSPNEQQSPEVSTDDTGSTNGFNAQTFLLGVYQTAEQGVAFLSSLLDLSTKFNNRKPLTDNESSEESEEEEIEKEDEQKEDEEKEDDEKEDEEKVETITPQQPLQRRSPKTLRHPNQL